MDILCWWLGELIDWIHMPYVVAVAFLGCMWITPRWLWIVHNVGMASLQIGCGNCPLVIAVAWLQGEAVPDTWITYLLDGYGWFGVAGGVFLLSVFGLLFAYILRTAGTLLTPRRLDKDPL